MSNIQSRIKSFINNPYRLLLVLKSKGCDFSFVPDDMYLQLLYKATLNKKLNLKNPKTFNEKLQWLKLYDRNPIYTTMVDKAACKEYFKTLIGGEYIIPTIGVYTSFDEIDFSVLPQKFVIKTTHDSGGVVICRDKNQFDENSAKDIINKSLKRNYYMGAREWPYKDVKPRIIIEEYLDCIESAGLIEYKIFCFDGVPKLFLVCKGNAHGAGRTNDMYDIDFNHIPVNLTYPNAREIMVKPKEYEKLLEIASKISSGIPQLRVDTYVADGKIYIGEATFFHDGGYCKFEPDEYDLEFGQYIHLPLRKGD